MTLSPFALEDLEALCLEPSLLMVDPGGPLLDQDDEAAFTPSSHSSLGGKAPASSLPSLSSCAAPPFPPQPAQLSKPTPTPPLAQSPSFLGTKADSDLLSSPWLLAGGGVEDGSDYDPAMDWMTEKMDLDELDLDSLIGSCSSDDAPSSPEELLASLDSQMSLDLEDFSSDLPEQYSVGLDLSLPDIPVSLPEPKMDPPGEPVKSEPSSPIPLSPTYTIELGSEVDVLDAELSTAPLPDPGGVLPSPAPIVLSIPASGHLVLVLAKSKDEASVQSFPDETKTSLSSDSDSDSGIESAAGSPPRLHSSPPSTPAPVVGSSRTKPYSKPEPAAASAPRMSKVKLVSGAPKVVEKKMKKMEQNKTAATRYRQKKRVEQEQLNTELEGLEKKNRELIEKAESISREIQYLKDLVEEVRKHHRGKTCSPVA